MQRLLLPASRALLAQPLRSKSSTVLPPFGEPDEEALRPTPLPADSCRTAGIERNGSAQKSTVCCRVQQTSPRGNSGSFDCGRLPEGTSASPKPVTARCSVLTTGSEACSDEASLLMLRDITPCRDFATTCYDTGLFHPDPSLLPLRFGS